MKAKLQQKEEGFDKWRDLSNIRGQKLQNLEPSYKGKNKFGVIKTDLIPEDLKKTVDDIRQKAEEHGLPSVIEDEVDEEFKRIEFKILEFDWIFRGESAKMFIEELAQASSDRIFTVEAVKTSIRFLWGFYQPEIIKKIYIPYMAYFLSFVVYVSLVYGSEWG